MEGTLRMPGADSAAHDPPDGADRLDGALGRWNARANAAYLDLSELVGAIQDDFEGLASTIARRHELCPTLQRTARTEDATATSLARLATMEEMLAGFHIELQTLQAQIGRAIGAAEALAEDTKALLSEGATAAATAKPGTELAQVVVPKTAREAQLLSQVDTMRAELLRVKAELSDTRAQLAARANAPQEAQTEIARLRNRVLELMALQAEGTTRRPQDLALQFERIQAQAQDAEGRRRRLGEILVAAGVISEDQLEGALREQQTSWNRHLGAILVELGFVSEETVAQTLAAQVLLPFVRIAQSPPRPDALALVSKALAHHHSCIPLRIERDVLVVAMANPLDLVAIDDVELATRRTIKPVVAAASEIKAALKEHYR